MSTYFNMTRILISLAIQLFIPLIVWATKSHNEKLVIEEGEEALAILNKIIAKTNDEDYKNKIIKQRDKLQNKLEGLKEGHEKTSPKLFKK